MYAVARNVIITPAISEMFENPVLFGRSTLVLPPQTHYLKLSDAWILPQMI
jgi:hypothetical protein